MFFRVCEDGMNESGKEFEIAWHIDSSQVLRPTAGAVLAIQGFFTHSLQPVLTVERKSYGPTGSR